jgi:hypothetical protein
MLSAQPQKKKHTSLNIGHLTQQLITPAQHCSSWGMMAQNSTFWSEWMQVRLHAWPH